MSDSFTQLLSHAGTYHTLFKLINSDVHDTRVLQLIRSHLEREGQLVRIRQLWRSLSACVRRRTFWPKEWAKKGAARPPADQLVGLTRAILARPPDFPKAAAWLAPIKILSDLDDTLYSSGGDGIGGVDQRFAKHQLYPGVLAFLRMLDSGQAAG